MTPETPRAQCRCGHSQMMHPLGLSENLAYTGTCMVCDCKEFDKVETPSIKKRPSAHWDHVERVAERQAETPRATQDMETRVLRILKDLPTNGEGWYIEDARPGREDEARVYDNDCYGVVKPTPDKPLYRRPIAEFVVAAPGLLRELQAELSSLRSQVEKLRALRDDMLDTARGCRAYGSVPCQCDPSWHAEVYEEWAGRLSAALGKDSR